MNRRERRARDRHPMKGVSALPKSVDRARSATEAVQIAQRLFQQGKCSEALPGLRQAIVTYPYNPDLRGALAYALASSGNIVPAIEQYRVLLEMRPDAVPVITNLAFLLINTGNLDEARHRLLRASELAPQHANSAFALAELLQMQKRSAEAFHHYRRAALLFQRKIGPNPGIQHCDDLIKQSTALMWTGDTVSSLLALDRAVELRPDHVLAFARRGLLLSKLRRVPEAIASLKRAAMLAPDFAELRRAFGEVLRDSGDLEAAQAQYEAATRLDPGDEIARYLLAAVKHDKPDAPPADYVTKLFDGYAQTFEQHLVEVLQYRAPEQVCAAVLQVAGSQASAWRVIDLGCGTGLCGPLIRRAASHLIGVDLSASMLDKAREKSVYDELRRGDAAEVLGAYDVAFDLALCADVMVYLGSLSPIFAAAARALKPGALFAFTTEVHSGDGFVLNTTRRYLHSRQYVENEAATHGFVVVHCESIVARYEDGEPVPEAVFVVKRAMSPVTPIH